MSAASYYDKPATHEEVPHLSSTSGEQAGPMHSGTQGYGQDMRDGMHEQQQRGFNNEQSGNGIHHGQEPRTGNSNYVQDAQQMNGGNNSYAQGAQQMQGNGAQGVVADDRDSMTKCNDNPPDYNDLIFREPFLCCGPSMTLPDDMLACSVSLLIAAVQRTLV